MATKKKTTKKAKYVARVAKKSSSTKVKKIASKTVKKKSAPRPSAKGIHAQTAPKNKKPVFKRGITGEELAKYWAETGYLTKKEARDLEESIAAFRRDF